MELTDYPNMGQIRIYDIEAISLPIKYNKFGDHDPNGLMYVLKKDSERIQKIARELFELPVPPILKAYVGDPSKIRLIHVGVKETHAFHRIEPGEAGGGVLGGGELGVVLHLDAVEAVGLVEVDDGVAHVVV